MQKQATAALRICFSFRDKRLPDRFKPPLRERYFFCKVLTCMQCVARLTQPKDNFRQRNFKTTEQGSIKLDNPGCLH